MAKGNPGSSDPTSVLRALLSEHRAEVWAVVLYALCVGLLALVSPVAVQALVNTVAFGTVLQPLVVLVALLFMGLLIGGVMRVLKAWTVEVLQRRMFVSTVARLAYRLPRIAEKDGVTGPRGRLVHRFFDLFSVQKASASLLLGGVDVLLAGGVGLLVLAFYHPLLLAFDVLLMLGLSVIVFGLGRGGVATSVTESSEKYAVADFLAEICAEPTVFRDRGGRAYAEERLDNIAIRYIDARAKHFRIVVRQLLGALSLQALASAGLLGLGGALVLQRELTLGQLVAAELIVSAIVSTLSDLGKYLETYYDLVASAYKLDGLLSLPREPEPEGGDESLTQSRTGPAAVELSEVQLKRGGRTLLSGASHVFAAGSRSLLTGSGESGKSSVLDLLFGRIAAQHGRTLLDGVEIREMSREALRDRVAIVAGPEVISGDVFENVRLGRRDIPVSRVRSLLEQLGLGDELAHLPDGFNTELGPQGARLSHGQALRLTIARALARKPGFVAIDADLAALDKRSLSLVLSTLCDASAEWTVLFVGDHPAVRAFVDTTLSLEAGQLSVMEVKS